MREYGILRGLVLAGWRLLRCNPWSYGGYDPVEAQRVFRIQPRQGQLSGTRAEAPPAPPSDQPPAEQQNAETR